ncbi:hypothetical protein BHM03_00021324 [Ensete ventricosum]|nr:hypothetical protein BHM03_00021324 [Ensete ventricosum]
MYLGACCMYKFLFLFQVEDFLDQSENFARSVGEAGMQKIYRCIHGSLSHLSRFAMRQINSVELRELLFKSVDDLNAPRKEGVHNEVVRHKRRYPFHDAGTSVKPTASKRPRYHQTPNVLPNPLAALQSQASYGIHRPGLNFWPPHPALTAYHRPFASFGAGYGLSPPLQHPFAASQRGRAHFPAPHAFYLHLSVPAVPPPTAACVHTPFPIPCPPHIARPFPSSLMPISPLLLLLLLCSSSLSLLLVDAARTADGSEEWGYVQVRPSNPSSTSASQPRPSVSSYLSHPTELK